MGNNPTQTSNISQLQLQQFLKSVEFVMETSSPHFGKFTVYKMLEKPFEYLMGKIYSALVDTSTLHLKKAKYEATPHSKNIIGFDHLSLRLGTHISNAVEEKCSKYFELHVFCHYYYFTLQEAILKKVKKMQRFPEEEVMYVAKTLVDIYLTLRDVSKQETGLFSTSCLFLSPEGFLKVYPHIKEWKQEKSDNQLQTFANSFFTDGRDSEVKLDLTKAKGKKDLVVRANVSNDILDIGVVLLSMITTAKETDYRAEDGQIKMGMINFVLYSFQDPENRALLLFRDILKGVLTNKWGIQQLKSELIKVEEQNNLKTVTRIRIINTDSEDNEQTTNSDIWDRHREQKLRVMPRKKLVAGKIECLTLRRSETNL